MYSYYQTESSNSCYHYTPSSTSSSSSSIHLSSINGTWEQVVHLASGSAVVVFSTSTCCMCHAVKHLFCSMGVSPTVYELDHEPRGEDIERALVSVLGIGSAVPVVFIGGKLIGTMDRVMASHINGSLVPLLKKAGALWL